MSEPKKFGTFGGVFTPTLLTILGVIMYLRLGWVVGNAGLLGAWLIIVISFGITVTTAMSMSSITTNIRIGAGGAYAIISQSLGLEVGGSLGIPRYISQGLAVTMYIFGFREGWLSIFPMHNAFLVDCIVFVLLYGIAYRSAELAIKTQYFIMGIIFLTLVSIVLASYYGAMYLPTDQALKWGTFRGSPENGFVGTDFWTVFAVFFPAATGIMAGANMSGELKNPRISIPKGTLTAIGVSFLIYVLLAYWLSRSASETELISNYNIMIEKTLWAPIMIAGILGATFSSALGSILGSSRILFAMGQHRVLPMGKWLSYQDGRGQPRNAMIVTGLLVFISMLVRDLNAIAPLVTMFFLVTYAMLNVVVIIEQNLGLISFRPTFSVHWTIPWVGLISSLFAMFIINPTVSLISWGLMFAVYAILSRRHLETPFEDVRSGLFSSFSEWAAKHTAGLEHKQERSWKPNLLVPSSDASAVQGAFGIIKDITYSKGSATLMGVIDHSDGYLLKGKLQGISQAFQRAGVYSNTSLMKTNDFAQGVNFGNQALSSAFFKPNIIFLSLLENENNVRHFPSIIAEAEDLSLGVIVFAPHEKARLGQRQKINIWIDDRRGAWDVERGTGNIDLSMLVGYMLKQNWEGDIRLIFIVNEVADESHARYFMKNLIGLARMPIHETEIILGHLKDEVTKAPYADVNIFPLDAQKGMTYCTELMTLVGGTCLFVKDSGNENILA